MKLLKLLKFADLVTQVSLLWGMIDLIPAGQSVAVPDIKFRVGGKRFRWSAGTLFRES
jgi:hypothetical protein